MNAPDWEKIYEQYSRKVRGYVAARVQRRADAEDICASVFEKVYRKFGAYDPGKAALNTWIFTITRNTLIDYYRKNRPAEELDENLASGFEVDEGLLNEETLSELATALKELPQEQQDIIVLLYYDGKPLTEIAAMMHMSYGVVKLRHQKALSALRKRMA